LVVVAIVVVAGLVEQILLDQTDVTKTDDEGTHNTFPIFHVSVTGVVVVRRACTTKKDTRDDDVAILNTGATAAVVFVVDVAEDGGVDLVFVVVVDLFLVAVATTTFSPVVDGFPTKKIQYFLLIVLLY
jgi:hypothetical protein